MPRIGNDGTFNDKPDRHRQVRNVSTIDSEETIRMSPRYEFEQEHADVLATFANYFEENLFNGRRNLRSVSRERIGQENAADYFKHIAMHYIGAREDQNPLVEIEHMVDYSKGIDLSTIILFEQGFPFSMNVHEAIEQADSIWAHYEQVLNNPNLRVQFREQRPEYFS